MAIFRYSRWDGSQEVFSLDPEDLMDRLSDHLMSSGNLPSALRSLLRGDSDKAGRQHKGIESLLQRLRQRRRDSLSKYDMDSVLGDITRRLSEVERLEREGMERRLQETRQRPDPNGDERRLQDVMERMAARNRQFLDNLPEDAASRLNSLREYEFMDSEAGAKFKELVDSLKQKLVEQRFKGLSQSLQSMDAASMKRLSEMVRDLNELLRERLRGGQPNFRQFKNKYSDMFGPDAPDTLDDLAEWMQRQAAQMDALLRSMSPEMRQQLHEIIESMFQDEGLLEEMAELARNLESLYPMRSFRRDYLFDGDEELTLDQALQIIEQLQAMDSLESQLRAAQSTANMSAVDAQLVNDVLGTDAVHQLEQLKGVIRQLEEAGYVTRSNNSFELTPKAMRRIGQNALGEIFAYIRRNSAGTHASRSRGDGGELTDDTRKYEYGDTFAPHLQKTLFNAAARQASENGGLLPLRLRPDDIEVYRAEQVSRSSTVLMIDLSLSMAMRGNFIAAKKVALALHNLIRTRFPQDTLHVVGFSTYARELKPNDLPYLAWDEFDPYTNIQHGLALAQQLLLKGVGGTRQIIMVSDGEPTAHVENNQLYLQYPPSPATLAETLKEVKRCSARGIIINTFMLDRNAELMKFVDRMSRISKGRVFYTTPEQLGQYIVVDYFASRRHVFR
ncbi:MAG: VWA domain-containing protein [Chloroflexi bacterium]|nr:VWA domain-containing protein [Chloroflexota bacterium]